MSVVIPSTYQVIPGAGSSVIYPGVEIGAGWPGSVSLPQEVHALVQGVNRLRAASGRSLYFHWGDELQPEVFAAQQQDQWPLLYGIGSYPHGVSPGDFGGHSWERGALWRWFGGKPRSGHDGSRGNLTIEVNGIKMPNRTSYMIVAFYTAGTTSTGPGTLVDVQRIALPVTRSTTRLTISTAPFDGDLWWGAIYFRADASGVLTSGDIITDMATQGDVAQVWRVTILDDEAADVT